MTDDQVRHCVANAIEALKGENPALDFQSVHERSTAHRLAVQFEPHFQGWNVDCEYDRDRQVEKLLLGIAQCDAQKPPTGYCGHHRPSSLGRGREHNLIVIELKKNAEQDACDRRKLELLTDPNGYYQYQIGLYINIHGGRFTCTWYKDGARSR